MGLFQGAKNTKKKAQAATVIQSLLEEQITFGGDAARAGRKFVEMAWNARPEVFEDRKEPSPHWITLVASGLAHAADTLDIKADYLDLNAINGVLGHVLQQADMPQTRAVLTDVDIEILKKAAATFRRDFWRL